MLHTDVPASRGTASRLSGPATSSWAHRCIAPGGRLLRHPPLRPSTWAGRGARRDAAILAAAGANDAPYDVVIVGGGISGLCTAQALRSRHTGQVSRLLLTESRGRVGGNITTEEDGDGFLWEEGPNSFQPNDDMLRISVDAGVQEEMVYGDPKAPRFVFWENKLRPTPSGPDVLTFDLLSIWGKIRAGLGAIGLKPPMPENYEESVEEFVRRNLGDEVFERLIEPFCSGVYAGDPAKLSMKAAFFKIYDLEAKGGSLVGGALKLFQRNRDNPPPPRDARLPPKPPGQTVGSFKQGLKTLPKAIAKNLSEDIKCDWKLVNISKDSDGLFSLDYKTAEGDVTVKAKCVALTAPAYVAAHLLREECPEAFDALINVDYPPVAAVTIAFPESAIREDRLDEAGNLPGFGQLHPRSQGVVTLGTIYSSSLFPNRAPKGMALLLNYIGGATNRGILEQTEEEIVAQVDKDVRKMLIKPDAPKPKVLGVRVWPKAIPQFNKEHLEALEDARASMDEAGWQGVRLGGNYRAGVALGRCVEFSYTFAEEIADFVAEGAGSSEADKEEEIVFT